LLLPGLPDDLELHHIIVNDWSKGVDAEQNVVLISIASVKDPSMAPEGKHVLHAYLPATEPYHLWKGLDRKRCSTGRVFSTLHCVAGCRGEAL
jgi:phytoene dehydrogenase-like protein